MIGGPSIVSTRKAVVGETKIGTSWKESKSFSGFGRKSTASVGYVSNNAIWTPHSLMNSMLIYIVSRQDPIKHDLSRLWLWLFSRARVWKVILKNFTQQEHSGTLTALVFTEFPVTVAQFYKLLDASMISANVKKFNLDLMRKKL